MQPPQPALSASRLRAQSKLVPQDAQAEAQSQIQTESSLPKTGVSLGQGAPAQAQHGKKRKSPSSEAAAAEPPRDPPSPPFPYPILAKRAPQTSRTVPDHDRAKPKAALVEQHALAGSSAPPVDPSSKPAADKGANRTSAAAADAGPPSNKGASGKGKIRNKASVGASAQHLDGKAGKNASSSKDASAPGQTPAIHIAAKVPGKPSSGGDKGLVKLKRCGTCKHCLQKQAKKGCLVLRALREQALPACATQQAQAKAQPAKTAKLASAAAPAPATGKLSEATQAEPKPKSAAQPAHAEGSKQTGQGRGKGNMPSSSKAGHAVASTKAVVRSRGSGEQNAPDRAHKAGQVSIGPEGSIHSALTHAVELASEMEQDEACQQQQQQAAEALESLRHSPVGPAPAKPAGSGLLATAPEQDTTGPGQDAAALGQDAAAPEVASADAEASPAKRGRGRPRKERKPGEEEPPVSTGPKRGRGRPRKSPAQPDALQVLDSSRVLPSDAIETASPSGNAEPETSCADAAPVKVSICAIMYI